MISPNNKTTLIIDDDEVFAQTLARRLSKNGFACALCHSADQALLKARQLQPSYIVLDMNLEQSSGLTLLKPLRSALPQARIVLLTGFASIATAVDAIKAGADEYLAKPADTNTVIAALLDQKAGERFHVDEVDADINNERLSADQAEWEHIQQALKFNQGNISATARQLGMHRRTLQRKLQKKAPQ